MFHNPANTKFADAIVAAREELMIEADASLFARIFADHAVRMFVLTQDTQARAV